jgi:hypothetical protein
MMFCGVDALSVVPPTPTERPAMPATHQTIKLGKGKHRSPDEGACVMELASMLAGEPFTDHPVSVCPVIGSLLRAYNDSIDSERRQDLYGYAAKVVGSRATGHVQNARAARVKAWVEDIKKRREERSRFPLGLRALDRLLKIVFVESHAQPFHVLAETDDEMHAEVLALIDELLAMKPRRGAAFEPASRRTREAADVSLAPAGGSPRPR